MRSRANKSGCTRRNRQNRRPLRPRPEAEPPDEAGAQPDQELTPERMQQTTEDRLAADVAAADEAAVDVAATRRQEQAPPYAVRRTGLAATGLALGSIRSRLWAFQRSTPRREPSSPRLATTERFRVLERTRRRSSTKTSSSRKVPMNRAMASRSRPLTL